MRPVTLLFIYFFHYIPFPMRNLTKWDQFLQIRLWKKTVNNRLKPIYQMKKIFNILVQIHKI
jgi:hypothetical protein